MEKGSNSRSRSHSVERNQASTYSRGSGGLNAPCNSKSDPVSAYLQRLSSNERDPSLCQGKESSRRYAAFLKQDGLLPLDNNSNHETRNEYNLEHSNIHTPPGLESPIDHIAPERLITFKEKRPSSTPANAFQLSSSRSQPGPGYGSACNFDVAVSKVSVTSIEGETETFENGLSDVTNQLELIQETQGNILTELASDIEVLQIENNCLRETRDRLQATNDNLLKVVHDLTKEVTRLKMHYSSSGSTSKVTRFHKQPEEMSHGAAAALSTSRSNPQILKTQIPNSSSKSGQKNVKQSSRDDKQVRISRSGRRAVESNSKTSYTRDDLHDLNTNGSQDDIPPHSSKISHSRENVLPHKSRSYNRSPHEKQRAKSHRSPRSEPLPKEKIRASPKSKHHKNYAADEPEHAIRHKSRYEPADANEDSDSDDYHRSTNRRDVRKKKKSGCFSFMRRRNDHEGRYKD